MDTWFDDPVLGRLPPHDAAAKLREVGENEAADLLEESEHVPSFESKGPGRRGWWPFQDKPWQHTSHAFGYLAPAAPGSHPWPIAAIGNIPADPRLKHARLTITLSCLRAASYAGGGLYRPRNAHRGC